MPRRKRTTVLTFIGSKIMTTNDMGIVPDEVVESIERYVSDGIPTGDFLRAVLCDSLAEAIFRADSVNRQCLPAIVRHVHEHVPHAALGDEVTVKEWITTHGMCGRSAQGNVMPDRLRAIKEANNIEARRQIEERA